MYNNAGCLLKASCFIYEHPESEPTDYASISLFYSNTLSFQKIIIN